MELEPKVELELFQPPKMQLQDYLSITSVKTAERKYFFKTGNDQRWQFYFFFHFAE